MRTANVVVLGCGPSGLVAAHTLRHFGLRPTIYSMGGKSPMFGAQYLHSPIEGIDVPSSHISYELWGSADSYRQKVYGLDDVEVSPQSMTTEDQEVWDIRAAYDKLWELYSSRVTKFSANSSNMNRLSEDEDIDLVINTIPMTAICRDNTHKFRSTMIWAAGDAPELGIHVDTGLTGHGGVRDLVGPDRVVCSGHAWHDWYRFSNIFGHATIEWPHKPGPDGHDADKPYPTASRVSKPIDHECTCWDKGNLVGVGRYGAWQKGLLVSDVADQVKAAVKEWVL